MAYPKTTWNNDTVPSINADNLNKIEQGIYDVTEEASNLLDAISDLDQFGIPPYQMSMFKVSENIFSDFSNHITGGYYNVDAWSTSSKIKITTNANWQGWLVRVKPNTTYTIGPVDNRIIFFSSDLTYNSRIDLASLSSSNPNTITTGDGVYWMTITQRITRDMSQWMMVSGSSYPESYISGYPQWIAMPKNADDSLRQIVMAYNRTPITVVYEEGQATVSIPSMYVVTQKGAVTITNSAELTITANASFIGYDVTDGQWKIGAGVSGHEYYILGWVSPYLGKCLLFANYTESGNEEGTTQRVWGYMYVSGTKCPKLKYTSSGASLEIPNCVILSEDGARSVTGTTLNFTNANWLTYDVDAQEFHIGPTVSGHTLIILGVISPYRFENSWINGVQIGIQKTIAFFGDSICAGVGTSKVFHQYIGERYGFRCLNYGYGGSGYVQSYSSYGAGRMGTGEEGLGVPITADNYFVPNTVITRLAEPNPSDLDGIVIFAGTNDWYHGSTISFQDFIDGVEATFNYLQTNFPKVPVLVMTPIHRKNDTVANTSTGKTLADYADAIIAECRKFGIAYVDTFGMSGLHPDNAGNDTEYYIRDDSGVSDGLHPNTKAHKRIESIVGEMLNSIVKFNDTAMR